MTSDLPPTILWLLVTPVPLPEALEPAKGTEQKPRRYHRWRVPPMGRDKAVSRLPKTLEASAS